jgi:hypothetical protein
MPVPSVETPPTPRENELLKRIKALEAENAALKQSLRSMHQAALMVADSLNKTTGCAMNNADAGSLRNAVEDTRARSDSDALKAYRRQIQAEALREAAELAFNMTENDNLSRAVLALIPDTDEVDECP